MTWVLPGGRGRAHGGLPVPVRCLHCRTAGGAGGFAGRRRWRVARRLARRPTRTPAGSIRRSSCARWRCWPAGPSVAQFRPRMSRRCARPSVRCPCAFEGILLDGDVASLGAHVEHDRHRLVPERLRALDGIDLEPVDGARAPSFRGSLQRQFGGQVQERTPATTAEKSLLSVENAIHCPAASAASVALRPASASSPPALPLMNVVPPMTSMVAVLVRSCRCPCGSAGCPRPVRRHRSPRGSSWTASRTIGSGRTTPWCWPWRPGRGWRRWVVSSWPTPAAGSTAATRQCHCDRRHREPAAEGGDPGTDHDRSGHQPSDPHWTSLSFFPSTSSASHVGVDCPGHALSGRTRRSARPRRPFSRRSGFQRGSTS